MAILHNYGNPEWAKEMCLVWSDIVNKLNRASSRANLLQLTRGYSASTDIIDLMKDRATFYSVGLISSAQINRVRLAKFLLHYCCHHFHYHHYFFYYYSRHRLKA